MNINAIHLPHDTRPPISHSARVSAPQPRFVCPDCNIIEGLLGSAPSGDRRKLRVIRVPFERPRKDVVALLGIEHQGLPALVLGDEAAPPEDAKVFNGIYFFDTAARIADWLAQRHGFFKL